MFTGLEIITIVWCVSILFNSAIRFMEHDTGSEWDGFMWCMYIASLAFAPFVSVCNIVDEFPYTNLNELFTSSMFKRRNNGHEC